MTLRAAVTRRVDRQGALLAGVLLACGSFAGAATAAALLGDPQLGPHATALACVTAVWWVLAGAVAARGRPGRTSALLALLAGSVTMTASGLLVPVTSWQLLCLGGHPVGLVLAAVHVRGWRLVLLQVVAVTGSAAVMASLHLPGWFGAYAAVSWAAQVVLPSTVLAVVLGRLSRARAEAETLSTTDALTGLLNRHGLAQRAPEVLGAAAASGDRLAVLLLDLDHFKAVNDTHGHSTGDRLLQSVATAVRAELRRCDAVVRWGGEELAVVTHAPDEEAFLVLAERLRRTVAGLLVAGLPPVTTSTGVASASPAAAAAAARSPETSRDLVSRLLDRADEALYAAKRDGRDRVVLHRPVLPAPRGPATTTGSTGSPEPVAL